MLTPCRNVESKQLGCWHMARSTNEAPVTRNQCDAELFGKHDIGGIICRKIVTKVPNPGQQHEMEIASDPEVQQIADCLIRTVCKGEGSFWIGPSSFARTN
jgi:hypothetical protein